MQPVKMESLWLFECWRHREGINYGNLCKIDSAYSDFQSNGTLAKNKAVCLKPSIEKETVYYFLVKTYLRFTFYSKFAKTRGLWLNLGYVYSKECACALWCFKKSAVKNFSSYSIIVYLIIKNRKKYNFYYLLSKPFD